MFGMHEFAILLENVNGGIKLLSGYHPGRKGQAFVRRSKTDAKLTAPDPFQVKAVSALADSIGRDEAQELLDELHVLRQMLTVVISELEDSGRVNSKTFLREW